MGRAVVVGTCYLRACHRCRAQGQARYWIAWVAGVAAVHSSASRIAALELAETWYSVAALAVIVDLRWRCMQAESTDPAAEVHQRLLRRSTVRYLHTFAWTSGQPVHWLDYRQKWNPYSSHVPVDFAAPAADTHLVVWPNDFDRRLHLCQGKGSESGDGLCEEHVTIGIHLCRRIACILRSCA